MRMVTFAHLGLCIVSISPLIFRAAVSEVEAETAEG